MSPAERPRTVSCVAASTAARAAALILAILLLPVATVAQESLGFRFAFGWQEPAGEFGDVMDGAVDADVSILVPVSFLRVGGGVNWASLDVASAAESWSQVRFHGLVAVPFRLTDRLRPYLEGRYTYRRLRPEDDRYFGGEDRVLRDVLVTGGGFEGGAGLEVAIGRGTYLDVAGSVGWFSIRSSLTDEALGAVDTGTSWRIHAGVAWFLKEGR